MPLAPGTAIGPYIVEVQLGSGGMGEVYRARDPRLRREVAVKVISRSLVGDAVTVDRFIREAIAASALNHPNVITIYETGDAEAGRYIAMELVRGRTLREVMREGLDLDALRDVGRQVAEALAVAHDAQIVHRDVKPDNVMVRDDGYVKVLDFGLARVEPAERDGVSATVSFATSSGLVIGTIGYMSPEQAQGGEITAASDVFSLGVVLYEAIAGQHPFPAASPLGVLHAILSDVPVAPSLARPGVPPALDQIVLECLQKDPRLRPTAHDVARALRGGGVRAPGRPAYGTGATGEQAFVGRAAEIAVLDQALARAAGGSGSVVAIAGEAGQGKTALVEAFLAAVGARGEPVRIGRGRSSERLAGNDAFLPVLEALDSMLRSESHGSLARVMRAVAPGWYAQLGSQPDHAAAAREAGDAAGSPQRLKREMVALLDEASRLVPIVLFFDDLHWADGATIDLLTYVSTRLASERVLVLLTYRPSALAHARHPFQSLKLDLQARGLCREILLQALSAESVAAYVEREYPRHTFPAAFVTFIHRRTEGHALFMVDLLRSLRQRGSIVERDGRWVLADGMAPIEREVPESVRSMIERKIAALGDEDRQLLAAAAVQGVDFDSAIVAHVLELDEAAVEERLDRLEREHAFVHVLDEATCPDRTVTMRFRFGHVLYQNALYASLRPTRRATLAGSVAALLVRRWGDRAAEIALELAVLFEAARGTLAAARYYSVAAQSAARLFAFEEAERLAAHGLQLVATLPEDPSRVSVELELQMTLALAVKTRVGYAAPAVGEAYHRARELCRHAADPGQIVPVLMGLSAHYITAGEIVVCRDLAEQLHEIAQRIDNPHLLMVAEWCLGAALHHLGELEPAHAHLLRALELHDPAVHGARAWDVGIEPGLFCGCEAARATWLLGRPDEALARVERAWRDATTLGHPQTIAFTLLFRVLVHQMRREVHEADRLHRDLVTLCHQRGITQELLWAAVAGGWIIFHASDRARGLEEMAAALDDQRAHRSTLLRPFFLQVYAEALIADGRLDEAAAMLDEADAVTGETSQRMYEPELHRLRGDVAAGRGPDTIPAAAAHYEDAIAVARRQGARGLELRAATALARLLLTQGDPTTAAAHLGPIVSSFTEGRGTADVVDALALLAACAAAATGHPG